MATVLLVTTGGLPIVVTGTTVSAVTTLVDAAYAISPTIAVEFTEQSMGTIRVNVRNLAYWREI